VRFSGNLSPALLNVASNLVIDEDGQETTLTGDLETPQLRAIIDVLVASDSRLVDVTAPPIGNSTC
jgi:hypothetical protein